MNRRQFLAASAAVAAVAANASEENETVFPVIDTHQHLWDLSKFRLPWQKNEPKLAKNHLMSDYLAATADLGDMEGKPARIVKTVYMEVDVEPSQQTAEAQYVLDLCSRADNPMVAAVISGRPSADGFAKYLDAFTNSACIKGVRQVLHGPGTPAGYCLDKKFIHGIRLLGERNLSYDLCMRPGELRDAAKLIDECPGTRFILDHCGNGDVQAKDRSQWEKDMAAVAERKNVVCKVSGIVVTAKPERWTADDLAPIIKHTLEVFGPDRVMFGGDWPVCTKTASFRQWFQALASIVAGRSAEEKRNLFHDNAMRFYRLEGDE
ncbi:MAG TPA: amidohydrolase family protein [Gemmataceae bacterium]|nr:amidohydrolase family protein [Gemmataceae bacterium]